MKTSPIEIFIGLVLLAIIAIYIWIVIFADCNDLGFMSIKDLPARCLI